MSEQLLLDTAKQVYAKRAGLEMPESWLEALNRIPWTDATFAHTLLDEMYRASLKYGEPGQDNAFDLLKAIRAVAARLEDLQNVQEALCRLLVELSPPPHLQLKWKPIMVSIANGIRSHGIMVDDELIPGVVRTELHDGYVVVQMGFERVYVDSLETGYNILLQREWSRRVAAPASC